MSTATLNAPRIRHRKYTRERQPGYAAARLRARAAAVEALQLRFPDEFNTLLAAELVAAGIGPSRRERGAGSVHGTSAAWWQHGQAGEPPCEPCRLARNEYQRNWRAGRERARLAALNALVAAHADLFLQLCADALREELAS